MKDYFKKTGSIFVTHYQGLTVKQIDEFSTSCKNPGSVSEMLFTVNRPSDVFSSHRQLRTPGSFSDLSALKSPSIVNSIKSPSPNLSSKLLKLPSASISP